ncbi:MAG: hypothetical protein WCA76_19455 [Candidatus Sulfotelmatobacter sp.]|jgi:hypothetical protein
MMDLTQSSSAAATKPPQSSMPQPENTIGVRSQVRSNLRNAVRNNADAAHRSSGFGMPCANCRLYYPANLDTCPACNSKERVSAKAVPPIPKAQAAAEPVPENAVVEKEREAFLKEFKSQLFAAHAEVSIAPAICTLGEHHIQGAEAASICKLCYDRLQERVDVLEAALHIDLKEAAQLIYDAVWADPSDPTKTYTNAAAALIGELRKRSGVANVIGPFQPLDN